MSDVVYRGAPELTENLPPVPARGGGDGYDWMEELTGGGYGWRVVPSWGLEGWDLGSWPLVIVALCRAEPGGGRTGVFGVVTYVEGDVTAEAFPTREERDAQVDRIAALYWAAGQADGPPAVPRIGPMLAEHCGPFSRARLDREWEGWLEAKQEEQGLSDVVVAHTAADLEAALGLMDREAQT